MNVRESNTLQQLHEEGDGENRCLGVLPFVVSLVSVFRMNVRGHFKNSIVHSFQNVDFKMCMCLIDVERLQEL